MRPHIFKQVQTKPMIVFINCYEEMATGMRILAAQAKEAGFTVHIIVLNSYRINISNKVDTQNDVMHVIANGQFHVNTCRDKEFSQQEQSLLQQKLTGLAPQMICLSTRSANDSIMPELLHIIRKSCPDIPVVCGGYGPTYNPEHYLINGADIVIRGEGEVAFATLLDNFRHKLPLYRCPSACYMEGTKMRCTALARPLSDISHVPIPLTGNDAVSFIENDQLEERDPAFDALTYNILVGRGCIAQCSYCAAPVLRNFYKQEGHHMAKYRRRKYEQVLQELEQAKKHGVQQIFFKDEFFIDSPHRLIDFFVQYQQRINLPFKAHLHPQQLLQHPDIFDAALDAGLYSYSIGFQAGTESMARNVYERPYAFSDLKTLANLFFSQHVRLQFHFVSGTSLNTHEEFVEKCALIASLPYDPAAPWRTLLMDFQFYPQPRSKLTQKLKTEHFYRLPVQEWAILALRAQLRQFAAEHEVATIESQALTHEDTVAFIQEAGAQLRKEKERIYYHEVARKITTKKILIMGERTPAYTWHKEFVAQSHVVGHIVFPGHEPSDQQITVEQARNSFPASTPIIMFGEAFSRFPNMLRRRYRLSNPIYRAGSL